MLPTDTISDEIAEKLLDCGLFSHLQLTELTRLFRRYPFSFRRYESGNLIAQRGDEYSSLMILVQGELSAEISDAQGHTLKVESLHAPSPVAAGILFGDDNHLPVSLTAVVDAHIISIHRDVLLKMAAEDPKLLRTLLRDAGNRIHFLADKLRFMKFHTIREKLCTYLLELDQRSPGQLLNLPYSMETLAELFGVSRPSLSRVMGNLVDQGLISRSGRSYRIKNRSALIESCQND